MFNKEDIEFKFNFVKDNLTRRDLFLLGDRSPYD